MQSKSNNAMHKVRGTWICPPGVGRPDVRLPLLRGPKHVPVIIALMVIIMIRITMIPIMIIVVVII